MAAEGAQVIPFRSGRHSLDLISASEAEGRAEAFLAVEHLERDSEFVRSTLSHPDVLQALARSLRAVLDTKPSDCAIESERVYRWLELAGTDVGIFDENDYFLGEFALIAGIASTMVGHLDDAEMWLDRAEAAFTHTVHPAPNLANVCFARLAIHYERGRFDHVLSLAPGLLRSYERLEMSREWAKSKFMIAMAQKMAGRREECRQTLQELAGEASGEKTLQVHVLLHLGEMLLAEGDSKAAAGYLGQGRAMMDESRPTTAFAHLHAVIGEALSREGKLGDSAQAYRVAVATYKTLGYATMESHIRLALAEVLLEAGEARQADWEVLAALPVIDGQGLEIEAKAAVALLLKSAQAKKTDPQALRRVRQHLKAGESN